jgi:hypothetical protein
MAEITAALDEQGANELLDLAIAAIGTQSKTGSGNLGPFLAEYTIQGTLTNGDVDLLPPDTIRVVDLRLDWDLDFEFGIDLSTILPDFCLPQVCVDVPCVGEVCTPSICVDWPTIPVPVSFGDFLETTADFKLDVSLTGGFWRVRAVILGVPVLQFGATSAALLVAIGLAATPVLLAVPFIGPFLAIAVNAILAAIAIAGVTGFLGPIITPFVSGLKIPLYNQAKQFEVLPADGPVDPKVDITLDQVTAVVAHNAPEDELVLSVDISP